MTAVSARDPKPILHKVELVFELLVSFVYGLDERQSKGIGPSLLGVIDPRSRY